MGKRKPFGTSVPELPWPVPPSVRLAFNSCPSNYSWLLSAAHFSLCFCHICHIYLALQCDVKPVPVPVPVPPRPSIRGNEEGLRLEIP